MMEIADFTGGERNANGAQPLLPFRLAYQRNALHLFEVPEIEFDVLPQRAEAPAVKIAHQGQQTDRAVLLNDLLQLGCELFIVLARELAAQLDFHQILARDLMNYQAVGFFRPCGIIHAHALIYHICRVLSAVAAVLGRTPLSVICPRFFR